MGKPMNRDARFSFGLELLGSAKCGYKIYKDNIHEVGVYREKKHQIGYTLGELTKDITRRELARPVIF